MFAKPKNGWTRVRLGDFDEVASNIPALPTNCLQSAILAVDNPGVPLAVYLDAGDHDYCVTANDYETHIVILDADEKVFKTAIAEINKYELAREIAEDIEEYLDAWVEWDTAMTAAVSKKTARYNLQHLLYKLKYLLEVRNGE